MKILPWQIYVLLCGATVGCSSEFNRQMEKSLPAQPGERLVVDVDRGSIQITTGPAERVELHVARGVRTDNARDADAIFADHQITFAHEDNRVVVRAEWKGRGHAPGSLRAEYKISVPQTFDVQLSTKGGSIKVGDLHGEVNVSTAGGKIQLAHMTGPVRAKTSGGDIDLDSCTDNAALTTAGGHIRVGKMSADLRAETSGGNISIEQAGGAVQAKTSGGSIRIGQTVAQVDGRTAGGAIDVTWTAQPEEGSHLETSAGGITVRLPDKAKISLQAETLAGHIESELPVTMKPRNPSTIHADLNGGGPLLFLKTRAGDIRLKELD